MKRAGRNPNNILNEGLAELRGTTATPEQVERAAEKVMGRLETEYRSGTHLPDTSIRLAPMAARPRVRYVYVAAGIAAALILVVLGALEIGIIRNWQRDAATDSAALPGITDTAVETKDEAIAPPTADLPSVVDGKIYEKIRGAIGGVILDAVTKTPLSSVQLRIGDTLATTGTDGRFAFDNLPGGRHLLQIERSGYFLESRNRGVYVTIASDRQIYDVAYTLFPAAVVTGRVLDPNRQPAKGAGIVAYRQGYNNDGEPTLVRAPSSPDQVTNDRGEFSIASLPPGDYILGIRPPKESTNDQTDYMVRPFAPFYFPATTDSAKAQLIKIQDGPRLRLDDIVTALVPRNPGEPLSLRMADARGLAIRGPINVTVRGRNSIEPDLTASVPFGRSSVQFTNLPPGSYEVLARAAVPDPETPGGMIYLQGHTMTGITDIQASKEVTKVPMKGGSPVGDIELVMRKAPVISGRVVMESAGIAGATVRLELNSPQQDAAEILTTISGADGSFQISGFVPMGSYRVSVSGLPSNAIVTDIRAGRTNITNVLKDGLRVEDNDVALSITAGAPTGIVRGVVGSASGDPVAGATVVLVPDDRSARQLIATSVTDQNGNFELKAIAPGTYRVFSWTGLNGAAYKNTEFIRKYNPQGTPIRIERGARLTLQLKTLAN